MKLKFTFFLFLIIVPMLHAQVKIPAYYQQEKSFTDALEKIITNAGLDGSYDAGEDGMEKISFAVIDLNGKQPVIGGVNMDNFIYPASVYKMYVAMEILKQVSNKDYSLYGTYVIKSPNDVDTAKEIFNDPRPLLKNGDTVTVKYLLDLMITRSDNSAANCLIDLANRKHINKTMHAYNWHGSEVTRKFLGRQFEDPGYDTIRGTETSALHAADFMYKINTDQLVNPWVSMQLKVLLGGQLDKSKLAAGLPDNAMYYHKTGWWSIYTNDVGIVDDGKIKYIIALFTPIQEEEVALKMKKVSDEVYKLISKRAAN
ncbi:serine hydrolase [Galbibacter pacificus]|uniref:beta-lactamase n=1 Tax=Galbibacter pacificus TaxID=2996052 RepID=A0ABT6FPU8_9FLAO|nr:serine hydrolase [Galbibacter pacificus]MDG3582383.1 class A beta-lactamase-related serine hydrolase [Galbibacter pacificus]MDG3585141.1 class A beta-lactamase-related serine hydrolase [Galbibacter pacificus]